MFSGPAPLRSRLLGYGQACVFARDTSLLAVQIKQVSRWGRHAGRQAQKPCKCSELKGFESGHAREQTQTKILQLSRSSSQREMTFLFLSH